jgi:23S rRNA (uracil1939-C5)-methyltransferase
MELNPNKIVYVSCNPETLVNDLQAMTKFYRITDIQAVDMFPHTPHVETVVKLAHK